MKKIITMIAICLCIPFAMFFAGCDDDKLNFENITFSSLTTDYDGNEHELVISGELPAEANVVYQNNKATNAGVYNAKVVISCEGYKTTTLNAVLTINKLNFENISFDNITKDYDGVESKIEIQGTLPQNTSVVYENNTATNAGVYNAKAILTCANYNTKTLNAVLTINKLNITGITFQSATVNYDGNEHSIEIQGTLPQGTNVAYTQNKATEAGAHNATAVITGTNYNTLTLNATLTIKPNLTQIANTVLTKMLKVPDVWSFLPDSFALEEKAYTGNSTIDFSTNFVNVSSLPQMGMGKQMNVVYSTLLDTETALSYLRYVYSSFNAIAGYYQTYVNANENNYASYEKTTENFTFKIALSNNDYKMYVNYRSVAIELAYTFEDKKCQGRIQLSNSNVIKYEMSDNELTIASSLVGVALTKLHFERDDDNNVNGYLIEYYGTETKNIKTSAIIKVDEDYTSIISNKRETDDLLIEGYMEVYDNETGNLIASEVKETVKVAKYDTKWFNLWDVTGINTIKILDDANGLNADSVYINGSANLLEAKKVGGFSTTALSRRFDIEMKDMYFYQYNATEEKYEKIKLSIPMLFVQNNNLSTFSSDFYSTNKSNGALSSTRINISSDANNYFNNEFANLVDDFTALKETITYSEIKTYIGNKNAYFDE